MEDKSAVCRERILPLIEQINKIAIREEIPFVLVFQTSDGGYEKSAYVPTGTHKEMRQLWKWLEEDKVS